MPLEGFPAEALARVDFYERWPRLEAEHLRRRISEAGDCAEATYLTKANLITWSGIDSVGFDAWCGRFSAAPWQEQAATLGKALAAAGVADAIVQGSRMLDRSCFVPPRYASLAFLNMSIPLGQGSNATMCGLTSFVAQAVIEAQAQHVVEVGFGSGLNAALLVQACPSIVSYTGYEPNEGIAELWHRGMRSHPRLHFVEAIWAPFAWPAIAVDRPCLLLFSCAVDLPTHRAILAWVERHPGASCIVPRPLLPSEFEASGLGRGLKWRDQQVGNYQAYLRTPRAYMVLERLRHVQGQVRAELVCSNIQYIAYRPGGHPCAEIEPFALGPLERLTRDS